MDGDRRFIPGRYYTSKGRTSSPGDAVVMGVSVCDDISTTTSMINEPSSEALSSSTLDV